MMSHIDLNNHFISVFQYSDDVGKGLPMLTPIGVDLKDALRDFLKLEEKKRGYWHIETPPLGTRKLYALSEHATKYENNMYPSFVAYNRDYVLRSVNCPNHYMMFKSQLRPFYHLPIRYAEMSTLLRKDKSGELDGLFRTNAFTINDAHIFCTRENVKREFLGVIDFIKCFLDALCCVEKDDIKYRLSLSDGDLSNNKYLKQPELWEEAEEYLGEIMQNSGVDYYVEKNKACYYGPKLDVFMKRINGKFEIIATAQLDFILPEMFDVYFINKNNQKERPVVIHRGLPFSMERTIGFLMERYQGDLPLWLAMISDRMEAERKVNQQKLKYRNDIDNVYKR